MCVVIDKPDNKPYAIVGDTVLQDNETFSHYGKTGLDTICRDCGYPFALSMQKHGRVVDTVTCFQCDKSVAAIIEKK